MADVVVPIGPPPAAKSYLNIDALIKAALDSGAEAVHPGYGFLSENAKFAAGGGERRPDLRRPHARSDPHHGQQVARARDGGEGRCAHRAGQRRRGRDASTRRVAAAAKIGYPVMIKASAGGGGRGIRVANDAEELRKQMSVAQAEAQVGIRRQERLSRALHPARAPRRGPGAGRWPRRGALLRARVLAAAPAAEDSRRGALARAVASHARAPVRIGRAPGASPWAIAAPARSNISMTTTPASSSSSR